MIFVTGDIHGEYGIKKLSVDSFYEQKEMTNQDENFVIICGDFGLVFAQQESKTEKYWLDWLEKKPFTTLFVDGNHENFDRLSSFKTEEWCGGTVHKIRPHVIHLMRGQIYNIDGCKIFAFGGASSHDIKDGILNPEEFKDEELFKSVYKSWRKQNKFFRVKGVSWWSQELPSQVEMDDGLKALNENNYEVDYIISHCCSSSTQALYSAGSFKPDILTDYFETIRQRTKFVRWFFGHYHDDRSINDKEIMLYDQIIRIW